MNFESQGCTDGYLRELVNNISISDVIELIETETNFNHNQPPAECPVAVDNVDGNTAACVTGAAPFVGPGTVTVLEQPYGIHRFRYASELKENRSAGSIVGVNSTPATKTCPTIQIDDCDNRTVVIVVSCVTKDPPYRPHPHGVVSPKNCKQGVYRLKVKITPKTRTIKFSKLGIQCIKKNEAVEALQERKQLQIDPFDTGFDHIQDTDAIDLTWVRLAFQIIVVDKKSPQNRYQLAPTVSEPINDKKHSAELKIFKLSDCNSYVDGSRKDIILLCEKLNREDLKQIQVRFFEEQCDELVWEASADFRPSQHHRQTAIWFRAPPYYRTDITEPVRVMIQLRRLSDWAMSEPLPFEMLPTSTGNGMLQRKRKKFEANQSSLWSHMQTDKEKDIPKATVSVENNMRLQNSECLIMSKLLPTLGPLPVFPDLKNQTYTYPSNNDSSPEEYVSPTIPSIDNVHEWNMPGQPLQINQESAGGNHSRLDPNDQMDILTSEDNFYLTQASGFLELLDI